MPVFSQLGALTTLQNAVAAAANGAALPVSEAAQVLAEISGTYTNITVNWEGSADGTNFFAIQAMPLATRTFAATATATGLYLIPDAGGLVSVRARTTIGSVTGTMTVKARTVSEAAD